MSANELQTIIHFARRVFKPEFEAEVEKLVFSVICYFYGKGFRMTSLGDGCDSSENTDELEQIGGWNSNKTIYQFKFMHSVGKEVLLVKCLLMGENKFLVSWVQAVGGDSLISVELSVSKFAGDQNEVLKNADQFIKILQQNEKQTQQTQGSATPQYNLMENQQRGTPQFAGMRSASNPVNPIMVGHDDLNPFGGLEKDFGGGSQVGPTHLVFRRKFGENEGLREGGPPGARFDFIGPPGMQGSHPGDYAMGGQARRRRDMDDVGPPTGQFPDHMFM
eukprot:TRINITY_DN4515_c0_g2_i1.p1 TRINITY_DN4515_c0_g2~~TRINITY_DN4515_c0_g2_i1.p1  ORF type:complete len:277 (+),score=50.92 TRINITY_DN4515_c0_g2_i1:150-980(+)